MTINTKKMFLSMFIGVLSLNGMSKPTKEDFFWSDTKNEGKKIILYPEQGYVDDFDPLEECFKGVRLRTRLVPKEKIRECLSKGCKTANQIRVCLAGMRYAILQDEQLLRFFVETCRQDCPESVDSCVMQKILEFNS